MTKLCKNIGRVGMPGRFMLGSALLWLATVVPSAHGAVTMTFGATAPVPGTYDQFNLIDDATIPGGTAPGGGTYNSQAFSDNNGPPGQTFTTPASASAGMPAFKLNAIWLKGAAAGDANFGGFTATTTWGIRISEVNGTTLTPVKTVTGIPTAAGPLGDEWFTWTYTGDDVRTLSPNKQYAFDLYSSAGWLGFDAAQSDSNYAGGTAFNSAGGAVRNFNGLGLGDLSVRGYDRTFFVGLTPSVNVGPGDVDGDGDTDLVDYGFIKANFFLAAGATRSQGDLNSDGRVSLDDYALWKNNAPAAVLAAVGVPEPASATLVVGALLGLVGVARRGRRCGKSVR